MDVGGEVVQLAVGERHTCALLSNGSVRCWGEGEYGKLGYGDRFDDNDNIGDDETPASIGDVDLGGPAIQVAVGERHSSALLADGTIRKWGACGLGKCGNLDAESIGEDEAPSEEPAVDMGGKGIQVTAGCQHTCALMEAGTVCCWGGGGYGQLGYAGTDDIGDDETPAEAGDVEVGGIVTQISAGCYHTCAVLSDGAVRCWGEGENGKLGYGNTENIGDDETAEDAGDVDLGGSATYVSAGYEHTCAVMESGAIRCWGDGSFGRLGYGNTDTIGDDESPASAGDVQFE